jgi:UDP-GlcNAc:undecaprenyl-phosphate/decaprenyl-phosphate GlcNAc-1-phosphate transferase
VGAYLLVFFVACLTTFVLTPLVRRVSVRVGAIDQPSDRKVHPVATPTMGGFAIYGGVLAALGLSQLLPFFEDMNRASAEPRAALVTCTLMVILGAIDDKRGASPLAKFTSEVFIGGVLILLGVQLAYLWNPAAAETVLLGPELAVPLTILWVVLLANAVNLVDGLDGLAAGMVAIAAIAFFVYIFRADSEFGQASTGALFSAITAGACVGFLPWNLHPARIFMGDSGSLLLGMLLALATISGLGRNPYEPAGGDFASVVGTAAIPLLILAIPVLDVALAIVRRTWRGERIGRADKQHLHHRLLDIGHGHRQAVFLMYLWAALCAGSTLAVGLIDGRLAVGAILLLASLLFLATALPRLAERRREANGNHHRQGTGEQEGAVRASPAPGGGADTAG